MQSCKLILSLDHEPFEIVKIRKNTSTLEKERQKQKFLAEKIMKEKINFEKTTVKGLENAYTEKENLLKGEINSLNEERSQNLELINKLNEKIKEEVVKSYKSKDIENNYTTLQVQHQKLIKENVKLNSKAVDLSNIIDNANLSMDYLKNDAKIKSDFIDPKILEQQKHINQQNMDSAQEKIATLKKEIELLKNQIKNFMDLEVNFDALKLKNVLLTNEHDKCIHILTEKDQEIEILNKGLLKISRDLNNNGQNPNEYQDLQRELYRLKEINSNNLKTQEKYKSLLLEKENYKIEYEKAVLQLEHCQKNHSDFKNNDLNYSSYEKRHVLPQIELDQNIINYNLTDNEVTKKDSEKDQNVLKDIEKDYNSLKRLNTILYDLKESSVKYVEDEQAQTPTQYKRSGLHEDSINCSIYEENDLSKGGFLINKNEPYKGYESDLSVKVENNFPNFDYDDKSSKQKEASPFKIDQKKDLSDEKKTSSKPKKDGASPSENTPKTSRSDRSRKKSDPGNNALFAGIAKLSEKGKKPKTEEKVTFFDAKEAFAKLFIKNEAKIEKKMEAKSEKKIEAKSEKKIEAKNEKKIEAKNEKKIEAKSEKKIQEKNDANHHLKEDLTKDLLKDNTTEKSKNTAKKSSKDKNPSKDANIELKRALTQTLSKDDKSERSKRRNRSGKYSKDRSLSKEEDVPFFVANSLFKKKREPSTSQLSEYDNSSMKKSSKSKSGSKTKVSPFSKAIAAIKAGNLSSPSKSKSPPKIKSKKQIKTPSPTSKFKLESNSPNEKKYKSDIPTNAESPMFTNKHINKAISDIGHEKRHEGQNINDNTSDNKKNEPLNFYFDDINNDVLFPDRNNSAETNFHDDLKITSDSKYFDSKKDIFKFEAEVEMEPNYGNTPSINKKSIENDEILKSEEFKKTIEKESKKSPEKDVKKLLGTIGKKTVEKSPEKDFKKSPPKSPKKISDTKKQDKDSKKKPKKEKEVKPLSFSNLETDEDKQIFSFKNIQKKSSTKKNKDETEFFQINLNKNTPKNAEKNTSPRLPEDTKRSTMSKSSSKKSEQTPLSRLEIFKSKEKKQKLKDQNEQCKVN